MPPMRRDMARQPDALRGLLLRASEFLRAGLEHLRPGAGGRVWACGCGDGLFAAEAAAGAAERAGLDWRPIGALDLLLRAGRLSPADRVVCVSMSGNVDRTVEAARAVRARGVPLLALVNGGGGRLGAEASALVSLDLPDIAPFLCGTASYTATVAALMLLAGTDPAALQPLADAQTAALRQSDALAPLPPSGVRLLSAGPDAATARYGAAKLVELTRVPAWHADLEEFAHSGYWSMPSTDLIVLIAADPALARYADDACEALGRLGVRVLAIDTVASPVPQAAQRITLPALDPAFAPLATAIPVQALAYALAEAGGLDPNTRLHLKNDTARFTVSRLLTRRSLVGTGA